MDIAIILAAGEGTRMKSKVSKVLHKVCGKPILSYIVDAGKAADLEKNIVVVGHSGEMVKEYFKDEDIIFKSQEIGEDIPYGTGYAVMQTVDEIDDDSTVVILYGDTPLIRGDTIKKLIAYHKENEFKGTVLTAVLEDTKGYGRIVRDESGYISKIVEDKDADKSEKQIKEINSGIYCFEGRLLKESLEKITDDNSQGEYYVTDVVEILKKEGHKLGAYKIEDSVEINGVNSRVQLAYCEDVIRARINERHMENGVTLIDPSSTYIEDGVKIGRDTIIYPGVFLQGDTEVGEDCVLRQGTRVEDSKIMNSVTIESSLIEKSFVDDETKIGPNAHLRPNCHIGKNIKIGNFVEVKNAVMKDNSKAGHLSYIGDADIGYNVNIGCGVVFVNYNGRDKFRTLVGDNAFIGSNSNIVAPIHIEDWAYIAAGSTITQSVKEGELSIARAKQVNKEGWVEKKGFKKS